MRSKNILTVFAVALSLLVHGSVSFVQGIAFWTSVVLPMAYVPLLVVNFPAVSDPFTVAQLTALNVALLVLGHGYGNSASHGSAGPSAA